jgi:hypothetical protein
MRPVNLMPLDRDVINTQFILRTRDTFQVGRLVSNEILFIFAKFTKLRYGEKFADSASEISRQPNFIFIFAGKLFLSYSAFVNSRRNLLAF